MASSNSSGVISASGTPRNPADAAWTTPSRPPSSRAASSTAATAAAGSARSALHGPDAGGGDGVLGRRAAVRHADRGAGGGEIEGDRGAEAPPTAGDEDLRVREIDHAGTLAPVTAPNWISVARIVLVPVCVALLLAGGEDEIRLGGDRCSRSRR